MVFLIIFLSLVGVIALVLLLLCLLIKVRLIYDGDFKVKVGALCFFGTVYPKKPKLLYPDKEAKKEAKKREKALKKHRKKVNKGEGHLKKQKKKSSFKEMFAFYTDVTREVFLPAAKKLGGKLHVKVKSLKVEIATDDAGETAVLYALAVSGGTMLLEYLRGVVNLKMGRERDIYIVSRFDKTEMSVSGELQIALRPLPTAIALLPALLKFLNKKQRFDAKTNEKTA